MKKPDPSAYIVRMVVDKDRHGEYNSWEVVNSNGVVVARTYSHDTAHEAAYLLNPEGRS